MQKQKYAGWMKKYAKITQATVPTKNEKICQNFTFIRTIQISDIHVIQKNSHLGKSMYQSRYLP